MAFKPLRAEHLTKQLLVYAGKGRFVIQPLDLSELVEEIRRPAQFHTY